MRTWNIALAVAAMALLPTGMVLASGPASAAVRTPLPPSLARFSHCPVSNPLVNVCLAASVQGTFQINSTTLSTTTPATISLGLIQAGSSVTAVVPTDGTPALYTAPIPIPGGLLGIPGSGVRPLRVLATPRLVGVPTVNLTNLAAGKGSAVVLPADVLVSNPLLGPSCTIGNAAHPIMLKLTDGATSPPPPNRPITGALGTVTSHSNGVIATTGAKLVDNAFAVPGANGCGLFGILDPSLDLAIGLPSAAGSNSATLSGSTYTAPASLIRSLESK